MKAFVLALVILAVATLPASAALRNVGEQVPWVFEGHVLTPGVPVEGGPQRVLYAPSEADDPAYRALIQAGLPAGSVVDYFDARYATPDAALLATYDAVHTWANYAFADNVLFGDNLADFVDLGRDVVLGAFCTYCYGNSLSGRIMTAGYCPVYSPTCSNHFATASWAGDDPDFCDYYLVTSWSALYRDYLALQSPGTLHGTFTDGEIADATAGGAEGEEVHYVNGSGGYPVIVDNNIAKVVANACECPLEPPTGTQEGTWGAVKSLFR